MNRSIENAGSSAAHQVAGWVPPVARAGYAAKGVVYVLLGYIAFTAAMASGQPEGASGALQSLVDESGGHLMLMLIAVGLLAHVIWRMVQAVLDPEHREHGAKRVFMRLFYALSAVIYGSLAYTAWQLSRQGQTDGGNGTEIWIARLLDKPFGTWLVMAAGVGIIGYGIHQLIKAARGDVNRRMTTSNATTSRAVRAIGRIGTAARGVVLLPIGWFVFKAGRSYSAATAADTGEVLQMLERGGLLAAVGLGLLAYGVHQIAKAVYRRIERPD
ncbi:DUF1206 domain-containing protein [Novilysobacter spongiicola]|uniref:DUF1206 domain-containing protein n=1 Tax=Lysobacter spongiicola DSM 21749 TaxID=1122188 RepID=A0A1T4SAV6_9GAMM|nr:DUF1206 domain-containing protein [Lysobacter spongiicola]SKA24981.1 protein of unknown function [Lysobacter spongiicola DSM 21749]